MEPQQIVWRIDLMGDAPRVSRDGIILARFQNPKADALLAYLAFYSRRTHRREILADLLWPDVDPAVNRNRLSLTIARLRGKLEQSDKMALATDAVARQLLSADRTTVALNSRLVSIDVVDFEDALAAAGRSATPSAQIEALENAVRLYGGELLPGFYENWIIAERGRLAESCLRARLSLARLLRGRQDTGDSGRAEHHARFVIGVDPTREEAHLELMRILDAAGRQSDALRHFQELTRILHEELGASPSQNAAALADEIRGRLADQVPPIDLRNRAEPRRVHGWARPPAPLTRFFGREAEIACILELTERSRLVTLLGMGGSGKTRLAIEAAAHLHSRYGDATVFVPLAHLAEARLVPAAIAEALRLDSGSDNEDERLDRIVDALASSPRALLVIDNLEHLIAPEMPSSLPGLVRYLLEGVSTLTVMVTSRQRLNVEGERELSVPPLSIIADEDGSLESSAAVRLFVDRARALRPGFQLTNSNVATVVELCRRLEGIPLAIELCAAWAQTLTPSQMLARIEDRFELLVSRRVDLPDRHRTLVAAIEYSYVLLPDAYKGVFLDLSVFRGGWSAEASGKITGADDTALAILREHSLVLADEIIEPHNSLRFRMLETLREFAASQLAVEDARNARQRHAEYFLELAETIRPRLIGPDQSNYLVELQTEHDNFRAALQWTVESDGAETGLRLANALHRFWHVRGHQAEGLEWITKLESLRSASHLDQQLNARVQRVKSRLTHWLGDNVVARQYAEAALKISEAIGDDVGVASALMAVGNAAHFMGDAATARDAYERCLALGRAAGNEDTIAGSLNNLGLTELHARQWETALTRFLEALALFRNIGHRNYQATALINMAMADRQLGDLDVAFGRLIEALAIHRSLESREIPALVNLGAVSRLRRDFVAGRSFLLNAVTLASGTGQKYPLLGAVRETGHMDIAEGLYERGLYLLGATEALRVPLKIAFVVVDPEELNAAQAIARAALGESLAEAAWQSGLYATLEQAASRALEANSAN